MWWHATSCKLTTNECDEAFWLVIRSNKGQHLVMRGCRSGDSPARALPVCPSWPAGCDCRDCRAGDPRSRPGTRRAPHRPEPATHRNCLKNTDREHPEMVWSDMDSLDSLDSLDSSVYWEYFTEWLSLCQVIAGDEDQRQDIHCVSTVYLPYMRPWSMTNMNWSI